MTDNLVPIAGRVKAGTTEALDRIAEALSGRVSGVRLKRSDALRVALERGIEVLERELGLAAADAAPPSTSKGGKRPPAKPAKK
ncbi:hypothetical protein [Sorangium sp. So ce693]|uniref:hypothetical protein n=1 Tax=Sorangium sp. So ce693 TaxID=3133318 RepID=UPI003F633179